MPFGPHCLSQTHVHNSKHINPTHASHNECHTKLLNKLLNTSSPYMLQTQHQASRGQSGFQQSYKIRRPWNRQIRKILTLLCAIPENRGRKGWLDQPITGGMPSSPYNRGALQHSPQPLIGCECHWHHRHSTAQQVSGVDWAPSLYSEGACARFLLPGVAWGPSTKHIHLLPTSCVFPRYKRCLPGSRAIVWHCTAVQLLCRCTSVCDSPAV